MRKKIGIFILALVMLLSAYTPIIAFGETISISTGSATNILQNSATLSNNTYSGLSTVNEAGIRYADNSSFSGGLYVKSNMVASPFTVNLSGLQSNTMYYYFAYIVDSAGMRCSGQVQSFKTSTSGTSGVITGEYSNVTADSAVIVDNKYSGIAGSINFVAVQYSLSMNMGSLATIRGDSIGSPYSVSLTGLQPNTTYYYRAGVQSTNGSNFGDVKSFTTMSPQLIAPAGLTVNSKTAKSVTITWDASQGVAGYEFSVNDVITSVGNVTTTTITDLEPETQYEIYIRATGDNVTSDWSEAVIVTTDAEGPVNLELGVPTGLAVSSKTSTSIILTWDAVANASGYEISVNETLSNIGDVTTFTINDLEPKTDYEIRIRAINANVTSDWSDAVIVTTNAEGSGDLELNAPTDLAVNSKTANSVTITWDAVADASGYEISVNEIITKIGDITTFTIGDLELGTTYEIRIRATDGSVYSMWSETIIVSTDTGITSLMVTYTYDSLNRLKSVIYPSGKVITYEYDKCGNITKANCSQ